MSKKRFLTLVVPNIDISVLLWINLMITSNDYIFRLLIKIPFIQVPTYLVNINYLFIEKVFIGQQLSSAHSGSIDPIARRGKLLSQSITCNGRVNGVAIRKEISSKIVKCIHKPIHKPIHKNSKGLDLTLYSQHVNEN